MQVRAKMRCNSVTDFGPESGTRVEFGAVYGTEGENADYAKATPSAAVQMQVSPGTKAAGAFQAGKCYYVDFTPAE